MERARCRCGWGVALALALASRCALAEGGGLPSSSQPRGAPARATICLIGVAAQSPELRGLLNELLARDNVDTRFLQRARFGSADVLENSSEGKAVDVFIVPRGHDAARLYFRAADHQRFLVRDVVLHSGLDALGRELLAQVVEASVVSLLHSGVGISRAEVRAELESGPGDAQPIEKPALPPKPSPMPSPARDSTRDSGLPVVPRAAIALRAWLAAKYAVGWSGAGQSAQSGPGFEVGLGVQRSFLVRARLSVEFDLPAQLSAGPIDARVSSDRFRALFDLGTELGPARAFALSIGLGQDRSNFQPSASRDPGVIPAPASRSTPLVVHSGVRLEAGLADVRCALAAALEFPLVRTPYQIDRGSSTQQLAQPWAVRPAVALSLAWQPRLAWF